MDEAKMEKAPGVFKAEFESDSEKVLAMALEFASRSANMASLDEISFMLTNDLRVLAEFDRCFLITHFQDKSQVVAATHQPFIDKKSKLQSVLHGVAPHLSGIDYPILFDSKAGATDAPFSADLRELLVSYVDHAECTFVFIEYFDDKLPPKPALMALVKVAPVFASALASLWVFKKNSAATRILKPQAGGFFRSRKMATTYVPILSVVILITLLLFFVELPFEVGGEAEIVPEQKQFAFCRIGGLIDKVFVRHGSMVRKGQVLATLDPRDLEREIAGEQRRFEILTKEMNLLRSRAVEDPVKLAKSELLELKRMNVTKELEYLKWQQQFLEIRAPVSGVVVSKDVEALSGKSFQAGEPFCEIAELSPLFIKIYVPEDRIAYVRKGQDFKVYLNNDPLSGFAAKVDEIAPRSIVRPRLGNVYEVRGRFGDPPPGIRTGMKGIGKINCGYASPWTIVTHRLSAHWNRMALFFK
jgi:multidrug resistance efflux pump